MSVRGGFSLLFLLVIITAIMAASLVVLPNVAIQSNHKRVDIAYAVLDDMLNPKTGFQVKQTGVTRFREEIGVYPGRISHMGSPITVAQRRLCGTLYTAAQVADWGAPYVDRVVQSAGLWLGIGMAQDSLRRTPTTGTPNTLIVVITGVDPADARLLNAKVDTAFEATPSTLGTIRWGSADAEGRVDVEWRKSITAC